MPKGFILAGGKGTRLRPITYKLPKPLFPVRGKPVISHLVELYLRNGVRDIKINIPHQHASVFEKWKEKCFPKESISFLTEDSPSGTLVPLLKESSWIDETLVVSNGDELKDICLRDMIVWHEKKDLLATMALVEVVDPSSYGVAFLRGDKITSFIEKPKNPPSRFVNAGLYIFHPSVKNYFSQAHFSMLETDLFPQLVKEEKLGGYRWQGSWQDIGTFSRWKKALKNWKS